MRCCGTNVNITRCRASVYYGRGTDVLRCANDVYFSTGGIVPVVAADLHRDNLQRVTDTALRESGLQLGDVDVIAVTVGPGLALCLQAGLEYVKTLAKIYR